MVRLILSIVTIIAAAGCVHRGGSGSTTGRCGTEAAATATALRVLETKRLTSEYFTERAKVTDRDEFWSVWFTGRVSGFPGECLINVRKVDCEATWVPPK